MAVGTDPECHPCRRTGVRDSRDAVPRALAWRAWKHSTRRARWPTWSTVEHEAGRIAGDRLVELGELAARAEEIDPDRPVVFYCRSGARSAMATQAFRRAGFEAYNLTGGLLAWDASGLPLEPEGGYVSE